MQTQRPLRLRLVYTNEIGASLHWSVRHGSTFSRQASIWRQLAFRNSRLGACGLRVVSNCLWLPSTR